MLDFIRRMFFPAFLVAVVLFIWMATLLPKFIRHFHTVRPTTSTTEQVTCFGNLHLLRFGPNDYELRGVRYPTRNPTEIPRIAAIGREVDGDRTSLIVRQLPELSLSPTGRPISPPIERYWRVDLQTGVCKGPLTAADISGFTGENPTDAIEFVTAETVFESRKRGETEYSSVRR